MESRCGSGSLTNELNFELVTPLHLILERRGGPSSLGLQLVEICCPSRIANLPEYSKFRSVSLRTSLRTAHRIFDEKNWPLDLKPLLARV
ncbi:MAG: hypothetical protein RSE65_18895 [Hafnia sp.]